MSLVAKLFGPLEVGCADGRHLGPRDFGGVKPKQVLEILLTERGRPVSKDRMADLLWGESLPRNVSATLETYVSVLRNRLEPGTRKDQSIVVTEPGAYRLDADRAEVDLDKFDELLARAATLGMPGGRATLEEALRLVRGEVLADEPYAEWAFAIRDRYRDRFLQALLDAGEAALCQGDTTVALARADGALATDVLCERAYRLSMLASYALGRQEDALRAFERCRKILLDELGVDPLEDTERLLAAIERHDDLASLLPKRTGTLAGGRAGAAAAARTASPMIGRAAQLDQVHELVAASLGGSASLTLIEGETGIGKTRLVEELVARLPGTPVGTVRCYELERELPYVPIVGVLRAALELTGAEGHDALDLSALAAELAPAGADQGVRIQALEALASVLERCRAAVLVLDDLHWADMHTIAALGYLVRRCRQAPVAIIGAFRLEEVGLEHPLRRLEPTAHVHLEALGADDVAALGVPGLFDRTGGHPLFIARFLEARADTVETLPENLQASALERCRAAGEYGFTVLSSAASFVGPFEVEALAALLDEEPIAVSEEVDRLCHRRILAAAGDSYGFRYDVVRSALLDSLSPARRKLLTGRAAALQSETDVIELSNHAARRRRRAHA